MKTYKMKYYAKYHDMVVQNDQQYILYREKLFAIGSDLPDLTFVGQLGQGHSKL